MSQPPATDSPLPTPPRAFTQGVGTVYQFVGVLLFVAMMGICCGSALLDMRTAKRLDLASIGWTLPILGSPLYSAQKAISVSLATAIGSGVALAAIGLGLQAQKRNASAGAVLLTLFGSAYWLMHTVFFAIVTQSIGLTVIAGLLTGLFIVLAGLAVVSWREMRRDPPPVDLADLPKDFKVPYSHLHADPPEVRLAKELEDRRRKLEIQQKELEALENRIKRHRYE